MTSSAAANVSGTVAPRGGDANRYWEVDALRGVAVLAMVVYHLMWDLWYWQIVPNLVLSDGFWRYWQRFTAGTFLILVGVSLAIAYRRMRQRYGDEARLFPSFCRRGLKIVGVGMLITIVIAATGVGYVDFGILHLIGVATILVYPLLRFTWVNFGLWVLFSVVGKQLASMHWDGGWYVLQFGAWWGEPFFLSGRWLAPLGMTPTAYAALDYFPLLPWLGVVLLGVFFGNLIYSPDRRRVPLPDWEKTLPGTLLAFLGRHSLLIYVVHQPLIIGILMMGRAVVS
jgi:uncharacterized membrane protein